MNDIRWYDPGNRPVFITAVCYKRNPFLKGDAEKHLLLSVMREVKHEKPYTMMGYVILDDHFHWMIRLGRIWENFENVREPKQTGTLTYGDVDNGSQHDISKIMQSVKLRFAHRYKKQHEINGNLTVWQRRFWDHIARDQADINRHMDYMHYNPVKHGYADAPKDYEFSSFQTYVERGMYMSEWMVNEEPAGFENVKFE